TFSVTNSAAFNNTNVPSAPNAPLPSRAINVNQVNLAPTLDPITSPVTVPENGGLQTIALTGISTGGGQSQTLSFSVTSSNTALLPTPPIASTNPTATGYLTFTPVANLPGTTSNTSASITITLTDNGNTAAGGQNTIQRSFVINVAPVNQAPTLNPIANPPALLENTLTATATATLGTR